MQGVPTGSAHPAEAWSACVKVLHDYDEHMVKGWKEDVDSLLVFVSFIVYTLLNRRPTDESLTRLVCSQQ